MVRVKINQGVLVGKKCTTENGHDFYQFLDVPYAEPPMGQLRFKSPQPPKPWEGERDATANNPNHIAQQMYFDYSKVTGSEDCLYLNVNTPKLPDHEGGEPLAVIVFIHGGGFIGGSGTSIDFNIPDQLIEHDVVLVTINYRLNVFGFLSLDLPEAAGNMGLKDQAFALKWVQENISPFGGDPNNVTINGQSAGSASVEYLLLSRRCEGLFTKAILQSGSTLNHWAIQFNILDLSVKLAQNLGYIDCEADMKGIHAFLMKQASEGLVLKAYETVQASRVAGLNFGFVPSIEKDFNNDEDFLTVHPYNLLDEGNFTKVPTIRGFCDMEGLLNEMLCPKAITKLKECKVFTDFWNYPFNPNDKEQYNKKLYELYFGRINNEDELENGIIEFFSDHDFTAGVILTAKKAVINEAVPCYLYMFAYDSPTSLMKFLFNVSKKGASHGADAGYTIGLNVKSMIGSELKPSEADILMSKRMCKMWTNFAKTGNPTPTTDNVIPLIWPAYNNEDQQYLVIDEQMRIDCKYKPTGIAIFEEIYDKYRK